MTPLSTPHRRRQHMLYLTVLRGLRSHIIFTLARTPNSPFRVRHHTFALSCTPNLAFRVRRSSNRPEPSRHKAGRAALGLSCVARFERSAGVLADRGDLTNQFADRVAS